MTSKLQGGGARLDINHLNVDGENFLIELFQTSKRVQANQQTATPAEAPVANGGNIQLPPHHYGLPSVLNSVPLEQKIKELERENDLMRKKCITLQNELSESKLTQQSLRSIIGQYKERKAEAKKPKKPGLDNPVIKRISKVGLNQDHLSDLGDMWAGFALGRISCQMEHNNTVYRDVFNKYAKKGWLTLEGFKNLIRQFEPKFKCDQLNRLWYFADRDASGRLDVLEYVRLFGNDVNGDISEEYYEVLLARIFKALEVHGGFARVYAMLDRSLEAEWGKQDMFNFLSYLKLGFTPREQSQIFLKMDTSNDGLVNVREFVNALDDAATKDFILDPWVTDTLKQLAEVMQFRGKNLQELNQPFRQPDFSEMIREYMPGFKKSQITKLWMFVTSRHGKNFDLKNFLSTCFKPGLGPVEWQTESSVQENFELFITSLARRVDGPVDAKSCYELLTPFISFDVFSEALKSMGVNLNLTDSKSLFSFIDVDRDGRITKSEFAVFFSTYSGLGDIDGDNLNEDKFAETSIEGAREKSYHLANSSPPRDKNGGLICQPPRTSKALSRSAKKGEDTGQSARKQQQQRMTKQPIRTSVNECDERQTNQITALRNRVYILEELVNKHTGHRNMYSYGIRDNQDTAEKEITYTAKQYHRIQNEIQTLLRRVQQVEDGPRKNYLLYGGSYTTTLGGETNKGADRLFVSLNASQGKTDRDKSDRDTIRDLELSVKLLTSEYDILKQSSEQQISNLEAENAALTHARGQFEEELVKKMPHTDRKMTGAVLPGSSDTIHDIMMRCPQEIENKIQGALVEDRYLIIDVLSVTPTSVFARCKDQYLERIVTAKLVWTSNEMKRHGFVREMCVLQYLCEEVSQVLKVNHFTGQNGDEPLAIIELLRGCTLSSVLDGIQTGEHESMSAMEVAEIANDLLTGMAHVHKKNVLNFNLNPKTIWLCPPLSGCRVKILDWELAELLNSKDFGSSFIKKEQRMHKEFHRDARIHPPTEKRWGKRGNDKAKRVDFAGESEGQPAQSINKAKKKSSSYPKTVVESFGNLYYMPPERIYHFLVKTQKQLEDTYSRGFYVKKDETEKGARRGSFYGLEGGTKQSVKTERDKIVLSKGVRSLEGGMLMNKFDSGSGVARVSSFCARTPWGWWFEIEVQKIFCQGYNTKTSASIPASTGPLGATTELMSPADLALSRGLEPGEPNVNPHDLNELSAEEACMGIAPLSGDEGDEAEEKASAKPFIIGFIASMRGETDDMLDREPLKHGYPDYQIGYYAVFNLDNSLSLVFSTTEKSEPEVIPMDNIKIHSLKRRDRIGLLLEYDGNLKVYRDRKEIAAKKVLTPVDVAANNYRGFLEFGFMKSLVINNPQEISHISTMDLQVVKIYKDMYNLICTIAPASVNTSSDVYAIGILLAQLFNECKPVVLSEEFQTMEAALRCWVDSGCHNLKGELSLLWALHKFSSTEEKVKIKDPTIQHIVNKAVRRLRYSRYSSCADFLRPINKFTGWSEITSEFLCSHNKAVEDWERANQAEPWLRESMQEDEWREFEEKEETFASWDLTMFPLGQVHIARIINIFTEWEHRDKIGALKIARFLKVPDEELRQKFIDVIFSSKSLSKNTIQIQFCGIDLPCEELPISTERLIETNSLWFVAHFVTSIKFQSFAEGKLSVAESDCFSTLCTSIKSSVALRSLDISGIYLSENESLLIGRALKKSGVRTLKTVNCQIKPVIADMLLMTTLTSLDLSKNKLGNQGAQLIGDALRANNTMIELSLSDNMIDNVTSLSSAILVNSTLRQLDLSSNQIKPTDALLLIEATEIQGSNLILSSNVSWSSDPSLQILPEILNIKGGKDDALPFIHQRTLALSNCGISHLSAQLYNALMHNRSIRYLDLQDNNLSHTGCHVLAQLLTKGGHGNSCIQVLDLQDNLLGRVQTFSKALYEELTDCPNVTLIRLMLGNNDFSPHVRKKRIICEPEKK